LIKIKFLTLGLLTSLLLPPFFILPLGFVIFPYFHKLIQEVNRINSFLLHFVCGFLYGLGFFTIFLIWIRNPFYIDQATENYAIISFLLIFILSIIFGVFFIIFKITRKLNSQLFLIPLIFILFEILIANLAYGFPWLTFSLIFSNNFFGSMLIYLFGTHLAGFIIICIFLIPTLFIEKNSSLFFSRSLSFLIISLFILLFLFYSFLNLNTESQKSKKINVDLLQMNFSVSQNNILSKDEKYNQIKEAIKSSEAELIIFGENNFPYVLNNLDEISLQNYIKDHQTLIIGATRKDNNNYYNSLLVIKKNHNQYFDKKILVPFGEFIPFRNYITFMEAIAGTVDFKAGFVERNLAITNELSFIPVICYEIIFFWRLLNNNNLNTNLIINITNDAWFGNLVGPYQHFYITKMRASEFNKPIIRVSNNGISGIINHDGKILKSTKLNQYTKINYILEVKNKMYNFLNFHKIYNYIFLIIFFCILIISLIKKYEK
tara:strand:+ start:5923 stop:7392 length:1470 start_codon:yes stop_codon:yes gene_type:complete